ncbi:MAG TPA: hypothetical protein ENK06_04240, partial [Gammaproteobacteria bacterium]|nr:hypothetical protein [Gammaproteobacteria bacterium]
MIANASSPYAIGAKLNAEINSVLSHCAQLRKTVGHDVYNQLIEAIETHLNDAMISVSFIGQVKAGKTSLVNALMGKPDFLPSDVNPWTAVVTQLFFGKPGGPHHGAEFAFFDDQQWDKLAVRGGRLGEIAAEIPESEDRLEDIHAEIGRMQERAMKHLGEKFEKLLGKTHRFDNAGSEVISRYICAGDDPEATVKHHVQGRYADITRSASVFFEAEKFAFPTILVDTPGLNDPLLIREEITLQSLEKSQIFVLVLSAHQALSSSDLYLLRILNSLRFDRLIVFVNRVDELTNPVADVPAIQKHIMGFLAKEIPGADIPVIIGSAEYANLAISGSEGLDPDRIKSMRAIRNNAKAPKSSMSFRARKRQSAWLASGLPMLEHALSDMMLKGPGDALVTSAQIDLENVVRVIIKDSESAINDLMEQRSLRAAKKPATSRGANNSVFVASKYKTESARLFAAFQKLVNQSLKTSLEPVQVGLQKIVDTFVEINDEEFAKNLDQAKESSKHLSWSCDTTLLRGSMNQYLREEFPNILQKTLEEIETGAAEISQAMVDLGLQSASEVQINTSDLADQNVRTAALSRIVAIDMDASWWKGWISKFMKSAKIRSMVDKMIRTQLQPIQKELLVGI